MKWNLQLFFSLSSPGASTTFSKYIFFANPWRYSSLCATNLKVMVCCTTWSVQNENQSSLTKVVNFLTCPFKKIISLKPVVLFYCMNHCWKARELFHNYMKLLVFNLMKEEFFKRQILLLLLQTRKFKFETVIYVLTLCVEADKICQGKNWSTFNVCVQIIFGLAAFKQMAWSLFTRLFHMFHTLSVSH